ncbi:hypothetical protein A2U01_0063590, partial [Trifolium medium]|nr:hypothetical protein [Trifolium medium]
MADNNTFIHELQTNVQKNAAAIDKIQSEMQTQFRQAEIANAERFSLMHEALDALLHSRSNVLESSHGVNS